MSILSNPTTMTREDVQKTKDLGADIFTVALDAATPEVFDRTRGKGVQSPHKWSKYWEIMLDARDIFGPQKFGAHIIVGMGETESEVLHLVQELVDLDGHSHMFCFFPEQGSLMDHLPATPRDQWRRVQLARYLIDYRDVRVEQMRFNELGEVEHMVFLTRSSRTSLSRALRFVPQAVPASSRTIFPLVTGLTAIRHRATSPAIRSSPKRKTSRRFASSSIFQCVWNRADRCMSKTFRIIDTGVREGRANIAFDAALIEERQADHVPDTIRFLRFPPTALIGRHQDLSREVDLDYCEKTAWEQCVALRAAVRSISTRGSSAGNSCFTASLSALLRYRTWHVKSAMPQRWA